MTKAQQVYSEAEADVYEASLETRNFHFRAFGPTEEAAMSYLSQALNRHAHQYKIPPTWWHECRDDIIVCGIEFGAAYRDNEEF
jgi:hypothetical protein